MVDFVSRIEILVDLVNIEMDVLCFLLRTNYELVSFNLNG